MIEDPTQTSFSTKLHGSITNAGPCESLICLSGFRFNPNVVDAEITFGSGLTIEWNGKPLGSIAMPPVQLAGDVGATIDVTGAFQVADVDHLTDFTKVMLTEESFEWTIAGQDLSVSALGGFAELLPLLD